MKKLLALLAILPLAAPAQQNPQAPAAPSAAEQLGDPKLSEADQQKLVKIFQEVQEMRKIGRAHV